MIEQATVQFQFANEHFHTNSISPMVKKKFTRFCSTGETVPFGDLFRPSEVVRNGRTYDRYVIHVAIKLANWKACVKDTTDDDI